MLATQGAEKLRGHRGKIITVRFPEDIWEPVSHPCAARVKDMEQALKEHQTGGGEIIARLEK